MDKDSLPLYPSVYPSAQIRPKESMSSSASPVPVMVPPAPAAHTQLLGPDNTDTVCHFCHANIRTSVKYTDTSRTHIAAALWCMACCMCCIPYGSNSAKNSDHYCPNCQRYLGTYQK